MKRKKLKEQRIADGVKTNLDRAAVARRNGSASHGPKSPAGKCISRMNATSHGMWSQVAVLEHLGETEQAWEQHLKGVDEHFQPSTPVEQEIAHRIALTLWRLRRVDRYEAEATKQSYESAERAALNGYMDGIRPEDIRRRSSLPDVRMLRKAHEAENHLINQLRKLTTMYEALQRNRRIDLSVVLAAVLIHVTPNIENEPKHEVVDVQEQ